MKRIDKGLSLTGLLLLVAFFLSCHENQKGMRGEVIDDSMMTLDGDTFNVYFSVSDDVMIVGAKDDYGTDLLIEKREDGLFYQIIKGGNIYPIDNTQDFVMVDNAAVYHVSGGKSYKLPGDCQSVMEYLGSWEKKFIFETYGGIWFTDGKVVGTQGNVLVSPVDESGALTLSLGVQSLSLTPAELYAYKASAVLQDTSLERINERYLAPSQASTAGFSVDIEVPKGDSPADLAIREFLVRAIGEDIFSELDVNTATIASHDSSTPSGILETLKQYSAIWNEAFSSKFPEHDTLDMRLTSNIIARRVVDNEAYVTYYYFDVQDEGGAHGLPFSYYVTYDKRQNQFVDSGNSVKKEKQETFQTTLLSRLTNMYNERHGTSDTADDALQPYHLADAISELNESFSYPCDKFMPMPHFAILPEGVVVTYHRYQVDSFAGGEYHVLIPSEEIQPCIDYDYWKNETSRPRLDLFLR
ncbi:MAG: hypothetical protein LUC44_00540 [Prevotellaceae bacterium]|nr:hypothetical protein [Prevotellaceae bacterium]